VSTKPCFPKLTGESHLSEVLMLSLAAGTENDSVQLPDDFDLTAGMVAPTRQSLGAQSERPGSGTSS
jgi:hypothetical protein